MNMIPNIANLDLLLLGSLTLGLVQIIKLKVKNKDLYPIIAIGVGIVVAFLLSMSYYSFIDIIITGLVMGLISSGVWDNLSKKKKVKNN